MARVQWRLKDDTLCVRSPHLDGEEWWETSDRAKALPDGRFLLQGRADRIAKIAEKRVSLVAMEEALLSALFAPELPNAQWRERRQPQAAVSLEIVPQLRVFDGHFPGLPVLPGVVQLDWAIAFARKAFAGMPARFLRAEQVKFQQPVLPPVQLELALDWDARAGHLSFRYTSQKGTHSSGRIAFGASGV